MMTNDDGHVDNALRELDDALAVAPAEDFAARVRARVRAEPKAASGWQSGWWFAAAAAIVLTAFVGRGFWLDTKNAPVLIPTPEKVAVRTEQTPASVPPPSAASTVPLAKHASSRAGGTVDVRSSGASRTLEVLVPSDQRIALLSFVRALADNRLDAAALVPAEPEASGAGPLFERITFTPIVFTIVTVPPNDDIEGRVRSVRSGD